MNANCPTCDSTIGFIRNYDTERDACIACGYTSNPYAQDMAQDIAKKIALNGWDFSEASVREVVKNETRLMPWLTEEVTTIVLSTIYV